MKKLIMIVFLAAAVTSCSKQSLPKDNSAVSTTQTEDRITTPPAAVTTAFAAKFGNVTVQQWSLRNDGTYRAHFVNNGVAWEATFTAAGSLVKSEAA